MAGRLTRFKTTTATTEIKSRVSRMPMVSTGMGWVSLLVSGRLAQPVAGLGRYVLSQRRGSGLGQPMHEYRAGIFLGPQAEQMLGGELYIEEFDLSPQLVHQNGRQGKFGGIRRPAE